MLHMSMTIDAKRTHTHGSQINFFFGFDIRKKQLNRIQAHILSIKRVQIQDAIENRPHTMKTNESCVR